MTRKAYSTDVNDAKWGIIEPLLPASQGIDRPRCVDLRSYHYLRLSKDYELLPEVSESMIYTAMIRLMLKRLATSQLAPS
jgi:hypothetical protein